MTCLRPRRTSLMAMVLVALACSGDAPGSDLEARLATMDDPDVFTMAYRAAGTDVLDCVQPNRDFAIDVDGPRRRFVVRQPPGSVVAERDGERLRLHRSLFDGGTTDVEWVEVDLAVMTGAQEAAIDRALGPDLVSYLLAIDPPASPLTQASSLFSVANSAEPTSDEGEATTFRLELDPAAYGEASELEAATPVAPPLVDISVDDDRVSRIVIRPAGDEAAGGWTIDFVEPPNPVPDEPTPGSTVGLDELDLDGLRAPPVVGCSVGDETPASGP